MPQLRLLASSMKSDSGLSPRLGLNATETPRDYSFCAYSIVDNAPFVVTDATLHPRVSDNPLVTDDPNIRFYAGVPLVTPSHHIIGNLCVIDFHTREVSEQELEILTRLARQVVSQLELRLALNHLNEANEALQESKQQAENASRAKSEFVASLSHELRTPMNSILGFTHRLIEKLGPDLKPRELDSLKTIDRNARTLLEMLNDLITVAKIESGKVLLQRSEVIC